jgi:hypothetical protein
MAYDIGRDRSENGGGSFWLNSVQIWGQERGGRRLS